MPAVALSGFIRGLCSAPGIMEMDQGVCQGMGDPFCVGHRSTERGLARRGAVGGGWSRGEAAPGIVTVSETRPQLPGEMACTSLTLAFPSVKQRWFQEG